MIDGGPILALTQPSDLGCDHSSKARGNCGTDISKSNIISATAATIIDYLCSTYAHKNAKRHINTICQVATTYLLATLMSVSSADQTISQLTIFKSLTGINVTHTINEFALIMGLEK